MRVTQKAIFDVNSYRLGRLAEGLNQTNEMISSGKRINRISDDPVGIGRTLDLRSGIAHLSQLSRNVSTGRTWLDATESAVSSVESLLGDTKTLALAMKNDSVNQVDRANAAVQVQETLMEIFGIANSRVNGQFLFSGTRTDTKPFSFDDPSNPTLVGYEGDTTGFMIKTGKDTSMVVGFPGEDVFGATTITIDETNNKIDFKENVGAGLSPELTATIPLGTYDKTSFAQAVEVALETASANGINYNVSFDDVTKKYTIAEETPPATLTGLQFLWKTGTNASAGAAAELGFDATDDTGGISYTGDNTVQWGIFRTLLDLKTAFENNDSEGISKSFSKLDDHMSHMSNMLSQIGYKGVALDVKDTMITDLTLSNKTQKAQIEEADVIGAISDLQLKESTYQAALTSTSKVMAISLVDYM